MILFGKSFIKFCVELYKFIKSFINLIKLVSTRTCSWARVRLAISVSVTHPGQWKKKVNKLKLQWPQQLSQSIL